MTSHFDFPSTFMDGTARCIEDVLESKVFESWPATVDQQITIDSDHLNIGK